jgi:Asp/Glu/hydantoin racemase
MSESVTEHIRREQEKIKRPDAELTVVNPEHGPFSIESVYVERELGAVVIDQTSVA